MTNNAVSDHEPGLDRDHGDGTNNEEEEEEEEEEEDVYFSLDEVE